MQTPANATSFSSEAEYLHAQYYVSCVEAYSTQFVVLDSEYDQIITAIQWLYAHLNIDTAHMLVSAIQSLEGYCLELARYNDLLNLIPQALQACDLLEAEDYWVHVLKFKCFYAIGEWQAASEAIEAAVTASQLLDSFAHAESLRLLGTFRLNRGDYQTALATLSDAEALFGQMGAGNKIAEILMERAAYHLNRGQFDTALTLYLRADEIQRQAGETEEISNHILLMLGVVYRRLRQYDQAEACLQRLIARASSTTHFSVEATAKHHLAWVCLDQEDIERANKLAAEARELYHQHDEPRGLADALEQLGEIAMQRGDFPAAVADLNSSFLIRQQLGNRHGMASSMKRLARAHFSLNHWGQGAQYTVKSLSLYRKLGMLTSYQMHSVMAGAIKGIMRRFASRLRIVRFL